MNIWSKPQRRTAVVQLSIDEVRQLWLTTFASAVISLRDWTPGDCRPNDVAWRRRLHAEELADFAVSEYRLLQEDSRPKTAEG